VACAPASRVSDNISVVSVVGRFSEHSRIYCSSATAASRLTAGRSDAPNLYNRVELVAPIFDDKVRAELSDCSTASLPTT
jgi:polyphosphate kinase